MTAGINYSLSVIFSSSCVHIACDSSCLGVGLGLCTTLGADDCCSFYHDDGSGFMCIDVCPQGFSANATFFCSKFV